MSTTIQITTDNYDGQTAVITFTPDNGGPVVNIGSQVLPYNYTSDYYYGTYSLYFPAFDTTCTLVIPNQTPTPTPTNTPTPTITPTLTPTPTQTQSRQYYVYKLCSSRPPQYVVQTQPGLTVTPGKVIRKTTDDSCWEFLYQTTNRNPFPSGTNVILWEGDYLLPALETIFDNCTNCFNPCVCYTVSYIGPPPLPNSNNQAVQFSYTNCSGVLSSGTVGYEVANPSVNVCAQVGTITITSGDIGCGGNGLPCATWDISTDVNCCLPPPAELGRCWTMTWQNEPTDSIPPPPSTLYVQYTNSSGVELTEPLSDGLGGTVVIVDNGDGTSTAGVCSYYPVAPRCVRVIPGQPPLIIACDPYSWTQFNTCTVNFNCVSNVEPPTSVRFGIVLYQNGSRGAACNTTTPITVYMDRASFGDCTILYAGPTTGTTAFDGWYTDGSISRYWDGSNFIENIYCS